MSAYEAICFQTRDLLDALAKDLAAWPRLERLIVGGEFSEQPRLLQLLADLCGITVERPQTSSPACLGAMLAAGTAMQVLTVDGWETVLQPPADVYQPAMCASGECLVDGMDSRFAASIFSSPSLFLWLYVSRTVRDLKYRRWKRAMQKCISWDTSAYCDPAADQPFDDRDPDQLIRSSIPGALFIFSSLALLLGTQFMQQSAKAAAKAALAVAAAASTATT